MIGPSGSHEVRLSATRLLFLCGDKKEYGLTYTAFSQVTKALDIGTYDKLIDKIKIDLCSANILMKKRDS